MTEHLGNSRHVTSNQNGVHDDLHHEVTRHLTHEFLKPYAEFSLQTFASLQQKVSDYLARNPSHHLIIDSCCGVGESTDVLASQHPDCLVIGIDKSLHRLDKSEFHGDKRENCLLVRGDLNDLWRLIAAQPWPIKAHYLLYPNPWPKAKHLKRRWHASPVFPALLKIGQELTVRSNWDVYIEEFVEALKVAGFKPNSNAYHADVAMTPFERKYWASGQQSFQLTVSLNESVAGV